MKRRLWNRDELLLTLNLYLNLPFGKLHSRTPEIIKLAGILNRTPSSIAMRLSNFASVDSFHMQRGVGGLPGGRKQVEPIWNEFINNKDELLFESENILAKMEQNSIEIKYAEILIGTGHLEGKTKIQEVKTRVNQNIFRQIVMANYSNSCAISGIDIPELLVASHIIPWSINEKERMNPENGISLSALYDKAFDKGLISFNMNYEVLLSNELREKHQKGYYNKYFSQLDGATMIKPKKYLPKKEFLEYHFDTVFRK